MQMKLITQIKYLMLLSFPRTSTAIVSRICFYYHYLYSVIYCDSICHRNVTLLAYEKCVCVVAAFR